MVNYWKLTKIQFLESTGIQEICEPNKLVIKNAFINGPKNKVDVTEIIKESNNQINDLPINCIIVDTGKLNEYPGHDIEPGYRKNIDIEYVTDESVYEKKDEVDIFCVSEDVSNYKEEKCCYNDEKCCAKEEKCCYNDEKCCAKEEKCCAKEEKCCAKEEKCCAKEEKCCAKEEKCCDKEEKCCDNINKCCASNGGKTNASSSIGDIVVNVKLNSAYDNDNDYIQDNSRRRQNNSNQGNKTNNSNQGNETDNSNNSNQGNETDNSNNSNQGNETDNSNNSNQGNTTHCTECKRRFKRCICPNIEVKPKHRCHVCNRRHKHCICRNNHYKPCKVSSMLYIPLYSIGRSYLYPNPKNL